MHFNTKRICELYNKLYENRLEFCANGRSKGVKLTHQ